MAAVGIMKGEEISNINGVEILVIELKSVFLRPLFAWSRILGNSDIHSLFSFFSKCDSYML